VSLQANYQKNILKFKFDAGTSRGVLKEHTTYFISIYHSSNINIIGTGEAAPLPKLSIDYRDDFEEKLKKILNNLEKVTFDLNLENAFQWIEQNVSLELPSIRFALETAFLDLLNGGKGIIFPSSFSKGQSSLTINGLIWMGEKDFMLKQIEAKLKEGFSCIKMKIGAINFEEELSLLKFIREHFSEKEITLRVDANGAFTPENALTKLEKLAQYKLHSIEQPIAPKQWEQMQKLCEQTPLPIALDEELIGIHQFSEKKSLLEYIKPQFIILKPTLLGGFNATKKWIELAESQELDWWITSALESNIGLSAISQFTATFQNPLPQGLGTGGLYSNNIPSKLYLKGEKLWYKT